MPTRPSLPLPLLPILAYILLAPTSTPATFIDNISYPELLQHLPAHPTLLFITARWCDHSVALAPELSHLARHAAALPNLLVARSDADDHPAIAAAFSARGYPTILYIPPVPAPAHAAAVAHEFADFRWAEIIADFVNNHTGPAVLTLPPRRAFLKWRRTHPFNLGASHPLALERPHPGALPDVPQKTLGIREPSRFTPEHFDRLVFRDPHTCYMVLFYSAHDPLLRELLVQWRQASSAFTGADNVTVALVDLSEELNQNLYNRFSIDSTPRCLFFPCCQEHALPECKQPVVCDDDMLDTENIVQFLADKVLEQMGFKADEGHPEKRATYHLTEEEYQRMRNEGTIFANELDEQDTVRALYQDNAKAGASESASRKDEL